MHYQDTDKQLIAILRGITPAEIVPMTEMLIQAGFCAIEVPLNSPDPFASIQQAADCAKTHLGDTALIGAGTVLSVDEVDKVKACGGNLIVSPNMDEDVISHARALDMTVLPGVMTPTEAFSALKAEASGLKFFPASLLGPSGISAVTAVLPKGTQLFAVGGVGPEDFAAYKKAGIYGFGLGSSLYKAGRSVAETKNAAEASIKALADCL